MKEQRRRLRYYANCVSWPSDDIDALVDMLAEGRAITRSTFLRRVSQGDLFELEHALGYADHPKQGLTMAADFHVSYYRSKLHGRRVYYFRHSKIEHVFTDGGRPQ